MFAYSKWAVEASKPLNQQLQFYLLCAISDHCANLLLTTRTDPRHRSTCRCRWRAACASSSGRSPRTTEEVPSSTTRFTPALVPFTNRPKQQLFQNCSGHHHYEMWLSELSLGSLKRWEERGWKESAPLQWMEGWSEREAERAHFSQSCAWQDSDKCNFISIKFFCLVERWRWLELAGTGDWGGFCKA